MHSVKVDAFLSCSFASADKEVNDYFIAICRALDIQCTNVDAAYSTTPPEVARQMIAKSQALIAVCTKRDKLEAGDYMMPVAVRDEISFAFGQDAPVLIFAEEGVQLTGFAGNFGTHLRFERDKLASPAFIEKAIRSVHALKLHVVSPHHLAIEQDLTESRADFVQHLVELSETPDQDYIWTYSTSKRVVYEKPSKRPFNTMVWATVPANAPPGTPPITWDLTVDGSSRGIKLKHQIEKQSSDCFEAILRLDPPAEEGDFIEYSTTSTSRYINPVWKDEVGPQRVHLDGEDFLCGDGLIFTHRTKRGVIEFRFPRTYGLTRDDIRPFVASYTSGIDHEVDSELKRISVKKEFFAGNLVVRIEIEGPLLRHMYGVAWNPRDRPLPLIAQAT